MQSNSGAEYSLMLSWNTKKWKNCKTVYFFLEGKMLCYSSVSIMRPCMSLILVHAHLVKRPNLDQHGCRTLHMFCPSLLAILPQHNRRDF